ncbi:MAG: serine/threonine protein kinase [Solirubrobacterales bacterium]|nr:serine/threonine protein kinase [Solirubrobacterales bacterium]
MPSTARTRVLGETFTAAGGLLLDRYRLVAPLGVGAFATVWLAVDERLAREVAVKVIPQRRVVPARFEREAWAAARLSHPAVVVLYEAATDGDAAYLVSELVRGSTLEQVLAEGRLSDREILTIGIALCEVLAYAHAQGIIHRDVKPSNILIPEEEASAHPPAKLTDFGVAHAVGGDSITATGNVVGTAAYMAPEQAAGREARPAADLYALALVLYEGLTGFNPLASITTQQRGIRLGLHLPPLRRQRHDLPRELGRGIDLALRPRPAERGTIGELRGALEVSLPAVSDVAGVVGNPWRPFPWRSRRGAHEAADAPTAPERLPDLASPPQTPASQLSSSARAGSAVAGAVMTGWLTAHALAPSPLAPAAAALAAAGAMLVAPRLGFMLVVGALIVVSALQGHAGGALLIALGSAVVILAAPRGRPPWPLAVGAPVLGALGLAGAWPALAARSATVRGRATLGFTGWIWLVLAGRLGNTALYVRIPSGGPPRSLRNGSPYEVIHHVLGGLLSSGALAPAVVWALAAVVLPPLLGRRSLARDAAVAAVWAGALVSLTALSIAVTHFASTVATVNSAVLGGMAAALVALAPSALAAGRARRRWRRQAPAGATRRGRRPSRDGERPTSKAQPTVHGGYTEAGVP